VLGLHAFEDAGKRTQHLGHCQHAQCVTCRRSVHNDEVESPVSPRPLDFEQASEFVDPGQRQSQQAGDIVLVEPGAAKGDLLECGLAAAKPSIERTARVDLDGVKDATADADLTRDG